MLPVLRSINDGLARTLYTSLLTWRREFPRNPGEFLCATFTFYCGGSIVIMNDYVLLITGSIARRATCRYLIYSEADFEVFRPAGATHCTDWAPKFHPQFGGEIWHRGGDQKLPSMPNFTPIGATVRV